MIESTALNDPPATAPMTAPAGTPPPIPAATPVGLASHPYAAASRTAIVTQNLTKRYGQLVALDNLTLELVPGDVFGFIGPNGAGKSTTMKIVAGLLAPTSGQAL